MTNDMDATGSIKPKRTAETTRKTHLARLEEVEQWAIDTAKSNRKEARDFDPNNPTSMFLVYAEQTDNWAASLRWAIEELSK